MKKIGYFKAVKDGKIKYISYTEFYNYDKEYVEYLRSMQEKGELKLSCGCKDNEDLGLKISKNHVIRVTENKNQENHAESCPKSEKYQSWLSKNQPGAFMDEDGNLCFNITVPTGYKYENNGSSNSTTSEKSTEKKYANVIELAKKVNAFAFLKQSYSIKKAISSAKKENKKPEWNYKTEEDFKKLIYGVSNEINIMNKGEIIPFYQILFKKNEFYTAPFTQKFYIYAKIEKISEYKEDRKYQYITVKEYTNIGSRATIRILTEDYKKMVTDYESTDELIGSMLVGYVRHDNYMSDGKDNHWITLLKGDFLFTASCGLYLNNNFQNEKEVVNILSQKHILFTKPVFPLENYGGYIPTIIIEQYGKDIIVDICKTSQEKKKKELLLNNDSYKILLYTKKDSADDIIDDIYTLFRNKT